MSETRAGGFTHAYEAEHDLLRLEFNGRLDACLLRREMAARYQLPEVNPNTRLLTVCTRASIDEIDLAVLIAHHAAKREAGHPDLRTAMVVADTPGHLALAELWAATKPGGKPDGAGVFSNESQARAWLLGLDGIFR